MGERKRYTTYVSELRRLIKYMDREDWDKEERRRYEALYAIYGELMKKRKHSDITELSVAIQKIINRYVTMEQPTLTLGEAPSRRFDISAIDFELLNREFNKVKTKRLLLKDLEEVVQMKLDQMLFCNPKRVDYYETYQQIIDTYNAEQDQTQIEKTFMDLMDLAKKMSQEEKRYAREGFSSDEELTLYDMLFRKDLNAQDIKKLKEVAVTLLKTIQNKIQTLDHWKDKQETQAEVDIVIRDILWENLPACYEDASIDTYRNKIYEYVRNNRYNNKSNGAFGNHLWCWSLPTRCGCDGS